MPTYVHVLKLCIASLCVTAAYLTFFALTTSDSAIKRADEGENSASGNYQIHRRNTDNISKPGSASVRGGKCACRCEEAGKANNHKAASRGSQPARKSTSITHNPTDLTTRHINYFPPDHEPGREHGAGGGGLRLPDSLPWKSLQLRLMYVLKVLRHHARSQLNTTDAESTDLTGAADTVQDIHTKMDLAYRSSHSNHDLLTQKEHPEVERKAKKGSATKKAPVGAESGSHEPKTQEVCPETYHGTLNGYPFYEQGWKATNCSNHKPLQELLTIILDITKHLHSSLPKLISILSSLHELHPGIKINVAVPKNYSELELHFPNFNVTWVPIFSAQKMGYIYNRLVSKVTTPYTYVAVDIYAWNSDTRFARLIRELTALNVSVIGSALKDKSGIWSMNCYQTTHRHYALTYRAGYHHSHHECVYCNYTAGSFLARSDFLQEHRFDETLRDSLAFRDYLFRVNRLGHRVAVCPDSMQLSDSSSSPPITKTDGLQLARKWQFHRISTETETVFEFSCEELKTGCTLTTGRVVSPCCLKQLMDDILFVMRTFSENHIVSELQEGTLLGAVKLGGVLPWERDADIAFLSANFSAILGLRDYFLYHGYSMLVTDPLERRSDGSVTGGTIRLQGARWPIELWGQHKLQSDAKMEQGNVPTRISLGGTAVPVPRNPGLFVRNRYGREVYKHAQHWMALGLHSSWAQYQPGYFTRCPQPGHHDCLDLHPADGNLQFSPP